MSEEKIITYKGFNASMKCRGYQFEIGKTFEQKGEIKACSSGFHACEYPLDCFGYYEPGTSVYAICEQEGDLSRHEDDSKVASRKITIKAAINIAGLVKAAIEYTTERCDKKKGDHVKGNQSASSATGYRSASSATGDRSASSATGDRSASSATGYHSSSEITPADDGRELHAVAAAFGDESKAKAPTGSAIVCVYRNDDGELIHIRASKIGDNGIKPNVWYKLNKDGEFVEA
ncbi:hypothetical protein F6Q07_22685 [Pectobacterium parmentieri]|uniref:DUF7666 domain-containing protein n=1 Tax=Pectobacterium parmentieri TaxID=1905730 RepID=UPI0018DF7111|nr:hypothetical protein [Pectobacterium parmentieri]MBI0520872.1 hypothetical protein [Pectobacterium parmentieri]